MADFSKEIFDFLKGGDVIEVAADLGDNDGFITWFLPDDVIVDRELLGIWLIGQDGPNVRRIVKTEKGLDELRLIIRTRAGQEVWELSYPYDKNILKEADRWPEDRPSDHREKIQTEMTFYEARL